MLVGDGVPVGDGDPEADVVAVGSVSGVIFALRVLSRSTTQV